MSVQPLSAKELGLDVRHSPLFFRQMQRALLKDDYYETWIYKINEKSMPFIGIYHPSVGFDWQY